MLTHSFLSGVMRCGGIGILRVSDLSVVRWAAAESGPNVGAAPFVDAPASSVSIIRSSSSAASLAFACPAPSCISASSVEAVRFLCNFRRFFLWVVVEVLG